MSTTILTDEQIMHLWDTRVGDPTECMPLVDSDKTAFARAIEQAVLQSPEVQAWKRDAERYRYARDNIMEDHELPGSYYLSDEGEYWDKTIDAAMEKQP